MRFSRSLKLFLGTFCLKPFAFQTVGITSLIICYCISLLLDCNGISLPGVIIASLLAVSLLFLWLRIWIPNLCLSYVAFLTLTTAVTLLICSVPECSLSSHLPFIVSVSLLGPPVFHTVFFLFLAFAPYVAFFFRLSFTFNAAIPPLLCVTASGLQNYLQRKRTFDAWASTLLVQRSLSHADALLHSQLPTALCDIVLHQGKRPSYHRSCSAIGFLEIVNFDEYSRFVGPEQSLRVLNEIFAEWDQLIEVFHVEKVKSIANVFMVGEALTTSHTRHGAPVGFSLALFAIACRRSLLRRRERFGLRCGIAVGPVVCGVLGQSKMAFDVLGDTVNTASRMMTSCQINEIQCTSEVIAGFVDYEPAVLFILVPRYPTVKGKGVVPAFVLDIDSSPSQFPIAAPQHLMPLVHDLPIGVSPTQLTSGARSSSLRRASASVLSVAVESTRSTSSISTKRLKRQVSRDLNRRKPVSTQEFHPIRTVFRSALLLLLLFQSAFFLNYAFLINFEIHSLVLTAISVCFMVVFLIFLGPGIQSSAGWKRMSILVKVFCIASLLTAFEAGCSDFHLLLLAIQPLIFLSAAWLLKSAAITTLTVFLAVSFGTSYFLFNDFSWTSILPLFGVVLCLFCSTLSITNLYRNFLELSRDARTESSRADALLRCLLPTSIAEGLKQLADPRNSTKPSLVVNAPRLSVLQADIVGFTAYCSRTSADEVFGLLNAIFDRFDARIALFKGAQKIRTVGDCIVVASWERSHANDLALLAEGFLLDLGYMRERYRVDLDVRIGIATGPGVLGPVGSSRFVYDIFGPTVSRCDELEANGSKGRIHVDLTTRDLILSEFRFEDEAIPSRRSFFIIEQIRGSPVILNPPPIPSLQAQSSFELSVQLPDEDVDIDAESILETLLGHKMQSGDNVTTTINPLVYVMKSPKYK